jgi:hypothetical protein
MEFPAPRHVIPAGHHSQRALPLFRIKDHDAGLTTQVCLPAQRPAMHAARHLYTWIYETRNETGLLPLAMGRGLLVMPGQGNRCGWQPTRDQSGN